MPIENWKITPSDNNQTPPFGWPENMAPSAVNNSARQDKADVAVWYDDPQWLKQADVPTYVSGTVFTVPTDRTAKYAPGRRVKASGTTPFTIVGTISTSVFTTLTTVTVVWDSGSLNNTLNAVSVFILNGANLSNTNISGLGTMSTQNANAVAITGGSAVLTTTSGMSGAAFNEAADVTLASASTVNVGAAASNNIIISGSVTINAFDTIANGAKRKIRFTGSPTLTHNATSFILPAGGASIAASPGDESEWESLGSGNWKCLWFQRANGTSVVAPVIPASGLVQVVTTPYNTVLAPTAVAIPDDNTIPQSNEGALYMTRSITPTSASNRLKITVMFNYAAATQYVNYGALFQDANVNAVAAWNLQAVNITSIPLSACLTYYMVAGTTSSTTFTFRAGASTAVVITMNGAGGTQRMGGVMASSITIEEISV